MLDIELPPVPKGRVAQLTVESSVYAFRQWDAAAGKCCERTRFSVHEALSRAPMQSFQVLAGLVSIRNRRDRSGFLAAFLCTNHMPHSRDVRYIIAQICPSGLKDCSASAAVSRVYLQGTSLLESIQWRLSPYSRRPARVSAVCARPRIYQGPRAFCRANVRSPDLIGENSLDEGRYMYGVGRTMNVGIGTHARPLMLAMRS